MSMSVAKQKWYADRRDAKPDGVCSAYPDCLNKTDGIHKQCQHHRKSANARRIVLRMVPREEGQCRASDCKNRTRPGLSRCDRCAKRESDHFKKPSTKKRLASWRQTIKAEVFNAYGNTCKCCGESRLEFLTLDHILNDGAQHRRNLGGSSIVSWAINNNFPFGLQVLCMKCNFAKNKYGICPHVIMDVMPCL